MSRWARRCRVLAGVLSRHSGVAVVARFDRDRRGYVIQWRGGPDEQCMRGIAAEVRDDFPELDFSAMAWRRTAPR